MLRVGPGIGVRLSDPVKTALASLGRTEDVRFSPNNQLLAFADLGRNRCLILHVEIQEAGGELILSASDFLEIASETFRFPHGLDFIDDETLVVANRKGGISI